MSTKHKNTLVSLNGSPIYHYDEPAPWQPAVTEICLEQISDHIERHLGPIETVFHELASDTVHIDVHWVKASEDFPFAQLITSGMSDLPMSVPDDSGVPRHLELVMTLPGDWRFDMESFQDERWYWPVRLMKTLARLPHKHATWLGWGHTMPNGDPPEAFADNTRLCGAILLSPVVSPEAFQTLRIDDNKEIHFLAVVPLYMEEMNLKLRSGAEALCERFAKHRLNDIVDLARTNVARKRFGLF